MARSFVIPPSVRQELELFARLYLALPQEAKEEIEAVMAVLSARRDSTMDEAVIQAMLPNPRPEVGVEVGAETEVAEVADGTNGATGTNGVITRSARGVTVEYRVLGQEPATGGRRAP